MRQVIVVYKSISGFTRRYAQWIAEALGAECRALGEISAIPFTAYDVVIFGGSLHAVGINGLKTFRHYITQIGAQKVVLFAVGASPERKELGAELKSANLTGDGEQAIPLFYFRGGFDFSRLDLKNKALMTLYRWKLMGKRKKTADEKGMLAAYREPLDVARQKNIIPLLEYIRSTFPS